MLTTQPVPYRDPVTSQKVAEHMPVYGVDENPPGVWEEYALSTCKFGCKVYRDRISERLAVMHSSSYGCNKRAAREYNSSATAVSDKPGFYVDGEGNEFRRILTFSATGAHGWRRHYEQRFLESTASYMKRTRSIPSHVRDNF